MKRLVWILLVLAAIGLAAWYLRPARFRDGPAWQTRLVSQGAIVEKVLTTGNLEPLKTVSVGSQVSGIVQRLYVDFNSKVKVGQVVARIDPATLLAQEQQAVADLDSAQSGLLNAQANVANAVSNQQNAHAAVETAQAGVASAQSQQATAQAQLQQARAARYKAKATLTTAKNNYDRSQELFRQGFLSPGDLDTATSTYGGARADLAASDGQVAAAVAAIHSADAALLSARTQVSASVYKEKAADAQTTAAAALASSAQAQIRKSQANLAQIRVNLGYTTIRSPVDGIVISRLVDEGQTVAASFTTPTLFTVATSLKTMQVYANVDEADISRVFLGQSSTFRVDAYPGEDFPCVVSDIRNSPSSIQNVVTYQVLLDVRNDSLRLRPGMTANIAMVVAHQDHCVRIPNAALRFHLPGSVGVAPGPENAPPAGTTPAAGKPGAPRATVSRPRRSLGRVYIVKGGEVSPVEVTLGLTDGMNTEMVSGPLQPGQALVVASGQASPSSSPR